jgi:hypothetical protein
MIISFTHLVSLLSTDDDLSLRLLRKIENILIDTSNLFIPKNNIRMILKGKRVYGCSANIRRIF